MQRSRRSNSRVTIASRTFRWRTLSHWSEVGLRLKGANRMILSNTIAESFVSGTPQLILRLESFCLFAGALWAFQVQHASWPLFAVLFFAPDLSMLGYLVNPKIGAAA